MRARPRWYDEAAYITPRQRDVQAAYDTAFWRGTRRGFILGNLVGLPMLIALYVWRWLL